MSNLLFASRTALVTGGSRGIGRAISLMLARHGSKVAVNYQQNEVAAQEVCAQIEADGGQALAVQADVSQQEEVEHIITKIRHHFGPIQLLVNNAGIASTEDHDQFGFAQWKRMFDVNVDGPFLTTWAVKDEMIEQRYGRIVNISSLAGVVLKKRMIHYATSKAALISFTRHCAEAFAPYNVRVNCLAPGLTNTELARASNPGLVDDIIAATPMGRMADPQEMASVVKFLLSDDSSFVTGQTVVACGGRT